MRCAFTITLTILISSQLTGQHFQFSQYNFTDFRVNPALVSSIDYAQLDVLYRNQNAGKQASLKSTFIGVRYPLMTSRRRWSGIGASFLDDRSGIDGLFQTTKVGLSYAISIPLSRIDEVSLGIRGIYQRQRLSIQGLSTGSQYIPNRGFDLSTGNGESFNNYRTDFFTFSPGFYWQRLDRKKKKIGHFGASFFDINKPNESFFNQESQLASTITVSGGFQISQPKGWNYYPEFLMTRSVGGIVLNIGTVFIYDLADEWVFSNTDGKVNVIAKYVTGGYIIGGVQFETDNLTVGFSYDLPVANKTVNAGAIEFGVQLRRLISKKARKASRSNKRTKIEIQNKNLERLKSEILSDEEEESTSPDTTNTGVNNDKEALEEQEQPSDALNPEYKAEVGNLSHLPFKIDETISIFNFEFNQTQVMEKDKNYLREIIRVLKKNSYLKIIIIGHTDNVGSALFNKKLSEQRALSVSNYLIIEGISESRVEVYGKGEEYPIYDNSTSEGRSKNRRVEFILKYK